MQCDDCYPWPPLGYLITDASCKIEVSSKDEQPVGLCACKASGAAQAWEKEAAATQQSSLAPEQKWEIGRHLVASLGDPASAERCVPSFSHMTGTYAYLNRSRYLNLLTSTHSVMRDIDEWVEIDDSGRWSCLGQIKHLTVVFSALSMRAPP